ncbi:hypothetical protein DPMN_135082 [Dreissena polymorpha]|uniref:Uncharacterized protein n=1 Tax=Dreissena polymorpha TaxID=45954 RepID=A0A9D4G0V8_DREPO|nr:hypothetical protein DPMN_135082 [Dreissena polymorpha]
MNLLSKFHEDRTVNVASRVLTRFYYSPPWNHVFQANIIIFELIQNIIETNLLTKCHEDWTTIEASRVLTRKNPPRGHVFKTIFELIKTAPPPGGHVFSPSWTIFELFHDDWAKIVTSRVFTRNIAPPPGGHIFQRTGTIFELNQHII